MKMLQSPLTILKDETILRKAAFNDSKSTFCLTSLAVISPVASAILIYPIFFFQPVISFLLSFLKAHLVR